MNRKHIEQCQRALQHALDRLNNIQHNYKLTDFNLLETALKQINEELNGNIEERNTMITETEYFLINGYWKDDPTQTFEDYIVKSNHDMLEDEDDDIFYYGLSENDLKRLVVEKENNNEDFVVTSFRRT